MAWASYRTWHGRPAHVTVLEIGSSLLFKNGLLMTSLAVPLSAETTKPAGQNSFAVSGVDEFVSDLFFTTRTSQLWLTISPAKAAVVAAINLVISFAWMFLLVVSVENWSFSFLHELRNPILPFEPHPYSVSLNAFRRHPLTSPAIFPRSISSRKPPSSSCSLSSLRLAVIIPFFALLPFAARPGAQQAVRAARASSRASCNRLRIFFSRFFPRRLWSSLPTGLSRPSTSFLVPSRCLQRCVMEFCHPDPRGAARLPHSGGTAPTERSPLRHLRLRPRRRRPPGPLPRMRHARQSIRRPAHSPADSVGIPSIPHQPPRNAANWQASSSIRESCSVQCPRSRATLRLIAG